jgi:hypothetical protein
MNEKILFFDAGPVITLVLSRLYWLIPELKKRFGGKFYITPAVKYELVDRPLTVKRFEFEALQVMRMIREGALEIYEQVPKGKVEETKRIANSAFRVRNKGIDLVQEGEMESVISASYLEGAAVVMDERTLRLMIESGPKMKELLTQRFHHPIEVDASRVRQFAKQFGSVQIIRSVELIGVAYRLGLLDRYLPERKGGNELLLDAVLWSAKFNGCAVTEQEIEEIKGMLLKSS